MNILLLIVAIIAIVLLFTGGFVSALNWLLWVGIIFILCVMFLPQGIWGWVRQRWAGTRA